MTMKPTLRPRSGAHHRQEDLSSLRLHVTRGMGEWSAVPNCVRDAIAELLGDSTPPSPSISYLRPSSSTAHSARHRQGDERTPYVRHFTDSTDYHHARQSGASKEQRTPRARARGKPSHSKPIPASHSAPSIFSGGFGVLPVAPLDDEALLMSVRSFEDAEKLRQHAVRNTALFHNNVEQLSRDVRTHLLPEVRAAVQLHPNVLHELRVRSTGGDTPHVSTDAVARMRFEDALFTDVVEALQTLRRASIRFTANFFNDNEKVGLGIDPQVLPREAHNAAPSRSATTPRQEGDGSMMSDRHTLMVDDTVLQNTAQTRRVEPRRGRDDVRSTPPSSVNQSLDVVAFREEDDAPEDRSPRRGGRDGPLSEEHEAPEDCSPRRAMRGEILNEEYEDPDDRSPRRAGREPTSERLRSEEDEAEADRSPRRMHRALGHPHVVDVGERHHRLEGDARVPWQQRVAPTAQLGFNRRDASSLPLRTTDTDVYDDEPRVSPHSGATYADREPLTSTVSPSRVLDMSAGGGGEGTLPRRRYEYAPPPPFSSIVQSGGSAVRRTEPLHSGAASPAGRWAQLPPTSPSPNVAALRSTSPRRLVGFEPLALDVVAAGGGSVSPDSSDGVDSACRPRAVPPPGTPRTRNDYVIHPTPRGISVKKKTILVSRGASSDRSSAVSGVSPRSPANSMRGSATRHRGSLESSTIMTTTVPAAAV